MFSFFKEDYECEKHGNIAQGVMKFHFPDDGDCIFCLRCLREFLVNAGLTSVKPISEEKESINE